MKQIQILDNEECIQFADFENCDVYLLNRKSTQELDERIKTTMTTESFESNFLKFPQFLTDLYNENTEEFEYKIITLNCESFFSKICICPIEVIEIHDIAEEKSQEENATENIETTEEETAPNIENVETENTEEISETENE